MDTPILAFGLPRSGTTWIGKLFDSHPQAYYRHEPDSWQRMEGVPLMCNRRMEETVQKRVQDYLSQVPTMCSTAICGKRPLFRKAWHGPLGHMVYRLRVSTALLAERAGLPCPWSLPADGADIPDARLAWKSIESLGRLPLLLELNPQARGVHILRHPCGFIASVLRGERSGKFRNRTPSSEDYGLFDKLLESPVAERLGVDRERLQATTPVGRLAWKWLLMNEHTLQSCSDLPGYLPLRYEDVCTSPTETLQRVFEHCGLDWDPQTEAFINASTQGHSNAYYSIRKDPSLIFRKWREEMSPRDIDEVRAIIRGTRAGKSYDNDW